MGAGIPEPVGNGDEIRYWSLFDMDRVTSKYMREEYEDVESKNCSHPRHIVMPNWLGTRECAPPHDLKVDSLQCQLDEPIYLFKQKKWVKVLEVHDSNYNKKKN